MKAIQLLWQENAPRFISLVVGIGLWELISELSHSPIVPGPYRVFTTLIQAFTPGGIPNSPDETLGEALVKAFIPMMLGYFIAVATGVSLGILMGINRRIERLLDPFVNAAPGF